MVKPLDRIGDEERAIVVERSATGYRVEALTTFGPSLEPTLRQLLELMLPGVPTTIDLAAFVDQHVDTPLGRGDRPSGSPGPRELFVSGVESLAERGFLGLSRQEQRALISRMRAGQADEELGLPAKVFIDRLLDKALMGYLAHPATWTRIGFNGPAYPDGYAWIGPSEVVARHRQDPGWDKL
jgi:hypothetical protein